MNAASEPIIIVRGLSKTYAGGFQALKNIDLEIDKGEIIALLGPNGAGKTTLISIICGIAQATQGSVSVAGFDICKNYRKTRSMIGLVPQELTTDSFESVWSTVSFSRGLFGKSANSVHIEKILRDLSLWDKKDDKIMTLSGGMKRRLLIAKALSHEPTVLFLDEPTVGLDIQTRRKIWGYIKKIRKDFGMTIFISTHYMEEADKLCDRIGIIDHGKIQVIDTPKSMKSAIGNEIISFNLVDGKASQDTLIEQISKIEFVKEVKNKQDLITVFSTKSNEVIPKIFEESASLDMTIRSLTLKQPTLDDVFISYTGHDLRDENENKKYSRRKEYNLNRRKGL